MVKKFFRKFLNKKHKTDESVNGQNIEKEAPNNDDLGEQDVYEVDTNANEEELTPHSDVQIPEEPLGDLDEDEELPDLEDLPDLPPEVLSAIKESSQHPENQKNIEEESEEFNFTEIKTDHQYQDAHETNQDEEPIPFDFNEIKVDLPSTNKKPRLKNIINFLKERLTSSIFLKKNVNGKTPEFNTPYTRNIAHQLFMVTLVLITSYYSGKISSYLLGGGNHPPSLDTSFNPKSSSQDSQIRKLENLNPLKALSTVKKPDKRKTPKRQKVVVDEKKVCEESSIKSTLKLKVDTVIVLQDRVKSIASVQLRNKKGSYLREGDKLEGIAIIGAINLDKVIFRNLQNGKCEYLAPPKKRKQTSSRNSFSKLKIHSPDKAKELIPTDPNIKVEGNNYKIDKSIRNELLDNITDVLSQARAIQIPNSDGSISFKIVEIVPGSIYSKLNISENDVITKINGKKIENLNEIMNLFGRIKNLKSLELGIERDGIENDFQYSFE